jgi:hypothetical protein
VFSLFRWVGILCGSERFLSRRNGTEQPITKARMLALFKSDETWTFSALGQAWLVGFFKTERKGTEKLCDTKHGTCISASAIRD